MVSMCLLVFCEIPLYSFTYDPYEKNFLKSCRFAQVCRQKFPPSICRFPQCRFTEICWQKFPPFAEFLKSVTADLLKSAGRNSPPVCRFPQFCHCRFTEFCWQKFPPPVCRFPQICHFKSAAKDIYTKDLLSMRVTILFPDVEVLHSITKSMAILSNSLSGISVI